MSKIGLSVSFCIKAMVDGTVDPNSVDYIIAGIRCENEDDWSRLIDLYNSTYWSDCSDQAEKLLKRFRDEGRIIQPRLHGNEHYPMIADGIWVDNEDQIIWSR